MLVYVAVAAVSYLLGSIPFGYILVRVFLKTDIRQTGSGNIGATNVGRTGHKGLAIATLLLDALKGTAAVVFGMLLELRAMHSVIAVFGDTRFLWPSDLPLPQSLKLAMTIATLSAIAGHMFPVWLGFRGGKGVATALGTFLWLSPAGVLASFASFLVTLAAARYVSLGSIVAAVVYPIATYVVAPDFRDPVSMSLISAACLLVILKHHENIRRLLAGTENKFGAKSKLPSSPMGAEKRA